MLLRSCAIWRENEREVTVMKQYILDKSHIRKRLVNVCFGIFISFMLCSNFGYNE